jgi:signal transduction histidine kinase
MRTVLAKVQDWILNSAEKKSTAWAGYFLVLFLSISLFTISLYLHGEAEMVFVLLYILMIVASAALSGRGPATVAAALGALSIDYHFIRPYRAFLKSRDSFIFLGLVFILLELLLFLVSMLRQAAKEAVSQKQKAQTAVKLREETLAAVAHDLRQPLGSIQLQLQLAQRQIQKGENGAGRLEGALKAVSRLDSIIQDLLEAAKADSETLNLQTEPIDLVNVARETITQMEELAAKKAIHLRLRSPDSLPPVLADKNKIGRVFSNLIGNSLKFTPPNGTVEVTIEKCDPSHEQVRVHDSGPGVPGEKIQFLFHRNWQEKETAHLGHGLGLYICAGILKAHNGSIWYEAGLEPGSNFLFRLPMAPQKRGIGVGKYK